MKWISWWAALLFVFVVSCLPFGASPPRDFFYTHHPYQDRIVLRTIPVYLDQRFTERDRLDIQNAIDMWNFALNGYVKIVVVEYHFDMNVPEIHEALNANGWILMPIDSTNPMIPPAQIQDNGQEFEIVAFCDNIGGNETWYVMDRIKDGWMFGVALHEMGHLLGASHNGKFLMSPHFKVPDYQCIDAGTMQQIADKMNLPLNHFNYCLVAD